MESPPTQRHSSLCELRLLCFINLFSDIIITNMNLKPKWEKNQTDVIFHLVVEKIFEFLMVSYVPFGTVITNVWTKKQDSNRALGCIPNIFAQKDQSKMMFLREKKILAQFQHYPYLELSRFSIIMYLLFHECFASKENQIFDYTILLDAAQNCKIIFFKSNFIVKFCCFFLIFTINLITF